jgi:competence ComEA-like helix-hairpin-helix protein
MNFDMIVKKIIVLFVKSKFLFLILLNTVVLVQANVHASFELKGSSARIQGMGQAYVGLANTPDAIFINCSGLAQLAQTSLSIFYTRPFGMKELSYSSFAAIIPTSLGNFATGITSFGNDIYREQSLILSINRSFKQKIYYGFNLHYMKLQISGYGSDFSFGVDLGFLIKITPKLNWGFFATNLNRATLGRIHDNLPQTFCTGFSIFPINELTLNMDIFKDSIYPLELRWGIEYLLFHRIALRSGFATEPSQFSAGFGFLFSHFKVDYAVTTHQSLGLTHHFSLQLQFKPGKENAIHKKSEYEVKPVIITKININTATLEQLQKIPGIGPTLALRIVAYRNQIGKFNSLEELIQIKGINKAKLESIKAYITLAK